MRVKAYGRTLVFDDPSWETVGRWGGTLSPEPETVAWIESMQPGAVLFDVGANVGRFSMLAACRGVKVCAFEPEAARYAELCRAVARNGLDIEAYCVAVSWGFRVGRLGPGRSSHTFGPVGAQAALSVSLDFLAETIGVYPDYVKIDVDGNEPDILDGAPMVLAKAKSVLVEIDPGAERHGAIVPLMQLLNYVFDPIQVSACTVPNGAFAGMANYIFKRAP
jgi:FkbM family methyltransferase